MAHDKATCDDQGWRSLASAKCVPPVSFKYYKPNSMVDAGCGLGPCQKLTDQCGVEGALGTE